MSTAIIEDVDFSSEMHDRFRQFGTYANVTRGVPNVLDGLKPVHRRILWAMYTMRALPGRKKYKSMDCIGNILRYHPHGDSSTYSTMATMAHVPVEGKPVKRNVPLIEGQGGWGDLREGPSAARYTECCLTREAVALLGHAPDIIEGAPETDENGVDLLPNYSGQYPEPVLLPALWPAFVVNGTEGIGVGVATSSPAHNLRETMNLAIRMVDSPNPRLSTVMELLPGPDMPCEADIFDSEDGGIANYIQTGFGSFIMRAKYEVEEYQLSARKRGHKIVVTALPYRVAPESVVEGVQGMIADALLPSEVEVSNFSTVTGIRVVIDAKECDPQDIIQRLLYNGRRSGLQESFPVYSYAVVEGQIRAIGVVEALRLWIDHRRHVVRRRSRFRLERAQDRMEIVLGFLKAIPIADKIVELVRGSQNRADAESKLVEPSWGFTERQAHAILDMTLSQLTKLSVDRYLDEQLQLQATIDECTELLGNPAALDTRLKKEMRAIREAYGEDRRCTLREGESGVVERPETPAIEIPAVNVFLVRTGKNWVRQASRSSVAKVVGNDYVTSMVRVTDQNKFEGISNLGWHYRKPMGELPERMTKADALFDLDPGESLVLAESGAPYGEGSSIVLLTKNGLIKRIEWEDWTSLRPNGKGRSVMPLEGEDSVQHALFLPQSGADIALVTAYGKLLRVDPDSILPKGRGARGNPAIRFQAEDDSIVWAGALGAGEELVYWTADERVGWFDADEVDYGNRNTQGTTITRSDQLILGVAPGAGNRLNWFDGTTDDPQSLILEGQSSGTSLSDRQLKLVAKGIKRANAIWVDSQE